MSIDDAGWGSAEDAARPGAEEKVGRGSTEGAARSDVEEDAGRGITEDTVLAPTNVTTGNQR